MKMTRNNLKKKQFQTNAVMGKQVVADNLQLTNIKFYFISQSHCAVSHKHRVLYGGLRPT
jgi:hypothetical protein